MSSDEESAKLAVGDEVLGFTDQRASQADLVTTPAGNLVHRPSNVSWEAAGSLFVVGTTAYAAVRAVAVNEGDTVVVSGAAAASVRSPCQLARKRRRHGDRPGERAEPPVAHRPAWWSPVANGKGVADPDPGDRRARSMSHWWFGSLARPITVAPAFPGQLHGDRTDAACGA